jgi:DNA-binding GntR family transcriptional regulator
MNRAEAANESSPRSHTGAAASLTQRAYDQLRDALLDCRFGYYGRLTSFKPAERDLVGELRELMEAAIAREADRAGQLLVLHMRRTADLLIAQLDD